MKEIINEILEDVGLEKINITNRKGKVSKQNFVTRDIKEILSLIVNSKK